VSINVGAVNDAPVATDDTATTNEDTPVIIPVLANDADVEHDALSPVLVSGPPAEEGTVTLNPDGSFTFVPAENFNGTTSFTYKVNDGTADSNVATVTINVGAVNDAPVATDDTATTNEDTPVIIPVLANDTDVEDDALTPVLVSGPPADEGSVTLNPDGTFTFTPAEDFNGTTSFTYKVNDGAADSNVATVTINVGAVNDAPVATDDTATTNEDTPVIIPVLANDADVEGDALTPVLVSGPSPEEGSVTLNPDGTFTFTPAENFNGTTSFTYKVNDGTADSNVATVTVNVGAVNDAPVATGDSYGASEDTPLVIDAKAGVLANDIDIDSAALTAAVVAGPAHGTLHLNADGSFTYTPNTDFNGTDSFTYKASDGSLDSNVATVTIAVGAVNDAPVANADSFTLAEDNTLSVAAPGLLGNDTDVDSAALTTKLVAGPSHGTLTLNADGSFSYTPNADFNGTDSFTYKANDGLLDGNVATVTLTVAPVNDAPVAQNDSFTLAEDNTLSVAAPGLLGNDTDIDSAALTAKLVTGPAHGTLTFHADGSFSYTPNADFNGTDSFTYRANDGALDSNLATVTLTVDPVNDAPVAHADSYSTNEDTALTVAAPGLLGNDTDVDSAALTAALVTGPAHGSLQFNADGSFTYTPNADYTGSDSFTYKASDGALASTPVTVNLTVNPVNDAPVAADDDYSTDEDKALVVAGPGVLANDTDIDNATLAALLVAGPAHGSLDLNSDGSFTYTPDENFHGSDSFTYEASDGALSSDPVTVTLTVNPVNDAPVAVADGSFSTDENKPLSIPLASLLVNDSDVDGDSLQVTAVKAVSGGTVEIVGQNVLFTPTTGFDGPASFEYTVSDGHGGTATATVAVNVVDSVPKATDDTVVVADAAHKSVDLVIILDRSGSMNDPSGVAGVSTRLELARAAIAALFEAYQSVADLHIQIVDFADSAASSGWLSSPEAADAYIAGLVASGGTNYVAAIDTAMAAYAGAPKADQTEVYFLSDGVPSPNQGLNADKTAQWEAFLTTNNVDKALAVGIGQLADPVAAEAALGPVAFPNGDDGNPINVTQPAELVGTLVGTVANAVSGNVLANDDFGADGKGNGGGGILSLTIDGVVYSFDGKDITKGGTTLIAGNTLVEPTLLGGLLEFHFDTGAFTYTAPDVDAKESEDFQYVIIDGDGDPSLPATLHIEIDNSNIGVVDPSVIFGADSGAAPNDNLPGTARDDIMSGGAGNDTVSGGEGNDQLQGGDANDSLIGGAGIDVLIGGAGDDRIVVGTGDRADGGTGNDLFILADNTGFGSIHGSETAALSLSTSGGDVLAFNGTLDLTTLANTRIDGIETVSMADSIAGAGADKLVVNALDVIDLGTGHVDPAGKFGSFGELKDAPAIRVDGDKDDTLALAGGGWQQVTSAPGGVPDGYVLYVHDSPGGSTTADAYVLVQSAVQVTGTG
jgi:VCBS repeat-containing protein